MSVVPSPRRAAGVLCTLAVTAGLFAAGAPAASATASAKSGTTTVSGSVDTTKGRRPR